MDHQNIARQTLVEHEMMRHLISALRVILCWNTDGEEFSRKLAGLRFTGHSFQRHLERLMALEEYDGYMSVVQEAHPRFTRDVDLFRQEHQKLRQATHRAIVHLERVTPTDHVTFEEVCNEIRAVLHRFDEHSRKEQDLLQEAILREEGGDE